MKTVLFLVVAFMAHGAIAAENCSLDKTAGIYSQRLVTNPDGDTTPIRHGESIRSDARSVQFFTIYLEHNGDVSIKASLQTQGIITAREWNEGEFQMQDCRVLVRVYPGTRWEGTLTAEYDPNTRALVVMDSAGSLRGFQGEFQRFR